MSYIHCFMTANRLNVDPDENPNGDTENGWVAAQWSRRTLFDNRNDAGTVFSTPSDSFDLYDDVDNALNDLPGGWDDNGDGTFYAKDDERHFEDPYSFSYALHFVEKDLGPDGYFERPWLPFQSVGYRLCDCCGYDHLNNRPRCSECTDYGCQDPSGCERLASEECEDCGWQVDNCICTD